MRRIVLHHLQGRLAGLKQIVGTSAQLQAFLCTDTLPAFVEPVDFGDHQGAAILIELRPHYVLYRETPSPEAPV